MCPKGKDKQENSEGYESVPPHVPNPVTIPIGGCLPLFFHDVMFAVLAIDVKQGVAQWRKPILLGVRCVAGGGWHGWAYCSFRRNSYGFCLRTNGQIPQCNSHFVVP